MRAQKAFLSTLTILATGLPAITQDPPPLPPWETIRTDMTNVRGVNFVPDYDAPRNPSSPFHGVNGPQAMWYYYETTGAVAAEVDAQLGHMQQMGVNCVRVWLSAEYYWSAGVQGPTNPFISKFRHFLGLCEQHRIHVMPVFWDSHGKAPDYANMMCHKPDAAGVPNRDGSLDQWTSCPGPNELANLAQPSTFAALATPYIRDVVQTANSFSNVFCWDIFNEPTLGDSVAQSPTELIIEYTATVLKLFDTRTPQVPRTVGVAVWRPSFRECRRVANHPDIDVLSSHPHCHFMDVYEQHVWLAAKCLSPICDEPILSKPYIATEMGGGGVGADYAEAVCYVRNVPFPQGTATLYPGNHTGAGFMLWQGMIGILDKNAGYASSHRFTAYTGISYTDGDVREVSAANAIRQEAINQGVSAADLATSFNVKLSSHNAYWPQAHLPSDRDDFAAWQAALTASFGVGNAPGGISQTAFEALQLFANVSTYSFGVYNVGPPPSCGIGFERRTYPALDLTFQLAVASLLQQYDSATSPEDRLNILEDLRNYMVFANQFVTGPPC